MILVVHLYQKRRVKLVSMLVKAYTEQYLRSGDVMILSGRFVFSSKGICGHSLIRL